MLQKYYLKDCNYGNEFFDHFIEEKLENVIKDKRKI